MFTEYITALVISYVILIGGEPSVVNSVTYFQSEDDCQHAFQHEEVADVLYEHLKREYGNRIMMGCEPTDIVSKPMHIPTPRPKIMED